MEITEKLKAWLRANRGLTDGADDAVYKAAALEALAQGALGPATLAELTRCCDDETEAGDKLVDEIAAAVAVKIAKPRDDGQKLVEIVNAAVEKAMSQRGEKAQPQESAVRPAQMFGGDGESAQPNVVLAHKQYSTARKEAFYPADHKQFANQRVQQRLGTIGSTVEHYQPMDLPSELDKAVSGAFFKFMLQRQANAGLLGPSYRMTDHDKGLMEYAMRELPWGGVIRPTIDGSDGRYWVNRRRLSEIERKALIDDVTSGGLEAAPIVFDEAVILTPLLHGELFPLVTVVPLARGRRVEGWSIGNPTITSGTAEGTAIAEFNTASMVAAFDTTIYNAVGALEIGRDFEEDAPNDVGAIVIQRYGDAMLNWLDNQIANGDGTTEPQGVLLPATGITDMGNPANGNGTQAITDDYEELYFSLGKQYREPQDRARIVFVANDTNYMRARAIKVGTTDARRIFGYDWTSYVLGETGVPYKVQNNVANTHIGCFNMRYYRMYRRLGMTVRLVTEDATLALKNLNLIVVRARFGGRLELGGAGAYGDNFAA